MRSTTVDMMYSELQSSTELEKQDNFSYLNNLRERYGLEKLESNTEGHQESYLEISLKNEESDLEDEVGMTK